MTRCPSCNHLVVFNAGQGKLKVRTTMLVIRKGEGALEVEIVCRRCGGAVPMELEAGEELVKALEDDRRLILRKPLTDGIVKP